MSSSESHRFSSACMMVAFVVAIIFSVVRVAQTANNEYFFDKPHVQTESRGVTQSGLPAVLWHAADFDAKWLVRYRQSNSRNWQVTQPIMLSRLNTELLTQRRVYRAELEGVEPGNTFEYAIFRNDMQVFLGQGRSSSLR